MPIDAHQEKLNFQAEVKQLLDIVVHSLYSNKEIFLRELISNASDATDKLRFESLSDPALYESDSNLAIRIHFDKDARTITISDNGIGMSCDEVVENLGTIAKSGTREFLARLTGDQKKDAHLIGQFGVGFYSAFIVADKVTVLTRRAGLSAEHGVRWESRGDGEYTVANVEKPARGTDVILHLKEDEQEFLDSWRLRNIVTKYSDHLNLPILMPKYTDDKKPTEEWETINRATALWALPKNAITPEQYKEFYKHISHDFEDPLTWTHHRIEGGNIEYTSILYLPAHAPFDLWQHEKHHGLKLYVQRVFILDQVEQFMPNYLRFVRGVIDTTALPLNVSREILQDHPAIPKLRSALIRHVLDLLDRIAQDEPEKYATFWKEFGNVLKEGPAEDFANRERIGKLLRFASTHADTAEQTVSFEDYVKRMKPNQKKIYYITADNFNAAKASPHLEIFRKNNIEVLLLADRIDEWVVSHLPEFDGKPLQSVAKGDLPLDEIVTEEAASKRPEEEKKEEMQQQEFDALIKKIKTLLDDKVKDVRLSHRLTTSPVCLVRDQNALGPQMERLLKAVGQPVTETKPILELNPDHLLVRRLREDVAEGQLNEWIHILYEEALLAEGGALPDPAAFVQRINKLWMEIFK
ncbi:molecular chaperone HtpG [Aquicella lusitana]|uniref:Chaperone protein HtpG n=1 Tax=Aquicella lusitana TaxID=254246 RepID=A0A370GH50_9COXI|nr:molecular chaperone HtpG [Aquicella lusitana]RDI42680.1 molecular chaperone HtpG [Aquicella lusitana]VVC73465.1 Chaperone protein HtpG [Aquicella lusitana]